MPERVARCQPSGSWSARSSALTTWLWVGTPAAAAGEIPAVPRAPTATTTATAARRARYDMALSVVNGRTHGGRTFVDGKAATAGCEAVRATVTRAGQAATGGDGGRTVGVRPRPPSGQTPSLLVTLRIALARM